MMRNGSCFMILFPIVDWSDYSKEASESNPLLVLYDLSNLSIKISYFTNACTQNAYSMALKSDPKWYETRYTYIYLSL